MKKGRTLPFTINELLNSPRMKVAISNFNNDPMFLKALLTELCIEVFTVTKNTVIKRYNTYNSLAQFELLPLLREINPDDLMTFNIYFNMSELEAKLYSSDPKLQLTEEERSKLLSKLKKQLMESS